MRGHNWPFRCLDWCSNCTCFVRVNVWGVSWNCNQGHHSAVHYRPLFLQSAFPTIVISMFAVFAFVLFDCLKCFLKLQSRSLSCTVSTGPERGTRGCSAVTTKTKNYSWIWGLFRGDFYTKFCAIYCVRLTGTAGFAGVNSPKGSVLSCFMFFFIAL